MPTIKRFDLETIKSESYTFNEAHLKSIIISNINNSSNFLKLKKDGVILDSNINELEININEYLEIEYNETSGSNNTDEILTFKYKLKNKFNSVSNEALVTITGRCDSLNSLPTSNDYITEINSGDKYRDYLLPSDIENDEIKYIVFKDTTDPNLTSDTKIHFNDFYLNILNDSSGKFTFIDTPNQDIDLNSDRLNWYNFNFRIKQRQDVNYTISVVDANTGSSQITNDQYCTIKVKLESTSCIKDTIKFRLITRSGLFKEKSKTVRVEQEAIFYVKPNTSYQIIAEEFTRACEDDHYTTLSFHSQPNDFTTTDCSCVNRFEYADHIGGFNSRGLIVEENEVNKLIVSGNISGNFPNLNEKYLIGNIFACKYDRLRLDLENSNITNDYTFEIDQNDDLYYIRKTENSPNERIENLNLKINCD